MLIRPLETLSDISNNDHSAIKRKIDADYNANQSLWQIFWTEATLDTRLEAGDTSLQGELNSTLPNNNRGSYYFNHVRPLLSTVSGCQRRNRKSSIVVPLENGDQQTADQFTKILLQIFKKENVYESISEAFHQGACITGMNLLHIYIDWQNDPISGDVKIDNLAYNQFFIDPYFRKLDLSDCNFVWRRCYLTHTAAAALMPAYYDDIMALPGNPTGAGRDGRFQYMPEAYGQTQQNRISYDEYYYRSYRKQKILVDKTTGETMEINGNEDVDMSLFLKENPQIRVQEQTVPTVRLAIMIQDKVFYDGPQPIAGLDEFPFCPVVGYYNGMMPYFYSRIQGIARSLRDPQMLFNRRVILSADLLESQVNSGWIFKENAPVDVKHLFQTGQGRIIPIKEEYAMTDIMQIQSPRIDASIFQVQETFKTEMHFVSGVNEELHGSATDDKAGILAAMRQGSALTTLQPLFDRLDASQILLSEKIMKVVRGNYTPGKIKSILEGQEPAPLFYNKAFGKYHCMVELGFNTESQKQMEFAQKLQLREMGVPIPDEDMIEAATMQNKDKLIANMQKRQQQAMQMQQQQAQVQMQEAQARTELAQARAVADRGLGVERMSRVEENHALSIERKAEAHKDDIGALLNYVKALKELENIDIDQMHKIASLQQMLKAQEVQQQENSKPYKGI